MPYFSYFDPFFDFETLEKMLEEIELLIAGKNEALEHRWNLWTKKKESEEIIDMQEAEHVETYLENEQYTVSELETNFLNGVAITLNSVFERQIGLIARKINEKTPHLAYNPKREHKVGKFRTWFKHFLKESAHPNLDKIEQQLFDDLQMYVKIRNILAHNGGFVEDDKRDIWHFVETHSGYFTILNEQLRQISVKPEYLKKVMKDQKRFFKLVCYGESGNVIY